MGCQDQQKHVAALEEEMPELLLLGGQTEILGALAGRLSTISTSPSPLGSFKAAQQHEVSVGASPVLS